MKKLLPIILALILFTSCKKERSSCYHCTFGNVNGQTPAPQTYCGDMPHQFFDADGNALNANCTK